MRIVTTLLGKLRDQVVGPVLCAGFAAITDEVLQSAFSYERTDRILVIVEVGVHVGPHIVGIQLVYLGTGSLGGGLMVGDAKQRVTDAEHNPSAWWRRPVEGSVGSHLGSQVKHFFRGNSFCSLHRCCSECVKVGQRSKRRFLFESIHACARV
jgi:hypothetical protein